MRKLWRVEKHTDGVVELERDGELLEIELPIEAGPRLIFITLCVGQFVGDDLVQILIGKAKAN